MTRLTSVMQLRNGGRSRLCGDYVADGGAEVEVDVATQVEFSLEHLIHITIKLADLDVEVQVGGGRDRLELRVMEVTVIRIVVGWRLLILKSITKIIKWMIFFNFKVLTGIFFKFKFTLFGSSLMNPVGAPPFASTLWNDELAELVVSDAGWAGWKF